MYAFIEGEVCEKLNGSLVLLASGVGWQLNCSNNTLHAAPALGEKMRCWTYLSVREDAMELFGFATREEKEMFLQLTSVSGIGPKTALGVLGRHCPFPRAGHRQKNRPADRAGAEGQNQPGRCFRSRPGSEHLGFLPQSGCGDRSNRGADRPGVFLH